MQWIGEKKEIEEERLRLETENKAQMMKLEAENEAQRKKLEAQNEDKQLRLDLEAENEALRENLEMTRKRLRVQDARVRVMEEGFHVIKEKLQDMVHLLGEAPLQDMKEVLKMDMDHGGLDHDEVMLPSL